MPLIINNTLYALARNDERMYALDPRTGSERWRYDQLGYATSAPVVLRGILFVTTADGGGVALSEADGTQIKRYTFTLYHASLAAAIH